MKNRFYWGTSVMAVILFAFSCSKDFINVNLSGKSINVLAPADLLHSTYSNVTFWWETVDGATGYNIQIVKPGFANMQQLLTDTTVGNVTQYHYNLLPGTYQWRIKATNSTSSTPYVTRTLYVDSTTNLALQTMTLISPANNFFTNNASITLQWSTMYSATKYVLQVINTSNSSTVLNDTLSSTALVHTFAQGSYQWQVKAMNATSSTPFSTPWVFTLNQTPPTVSALSAPVNGSTDPNPVALTWLRNANATADSVYVASDSLFTNIILRTRTISQSYNFNGTSSFTYYWRLKSYDAAGNASVFSPFWKFKVQ